MSTRATTWEPPISNSTWYVCGLLLWPVHLALAFPSILYLITLTIFLFRPPDLDLYHADRIALGVLVFFTWARHTGGWHDSVVSPSATRQTSPAPQPASKIYRCEDQL